MNRLLVLKELVEFSKPVKELKQNLSSFDWDFEGEPLIVYATSIRKVLERFISENCSANDLYDWANLIECREDLEFEESTYQALDSIINHLANPSLYGELTPASCVELIELLNKENNNR